MAFGRRTGSFSVLWEISLGEEGTCKRDKPESASGELLSLELNETVIVGARQSKRWVSYDLRDAFPKS